MKLSILDLCPILSGQTPTDTFKHTTDLAKFADEAGFHRYWMAEHHNMGGIGSSAPEVLIAHVASHTKKIRVGSGGIMLPNHATLHMAEVFVRSKLSIRAGLILVLVVLLDQGQKQLTPYAQ